MEKSNIQVPYLKYLLVLLEPLVDHLLLRLVALGWMGAHLDLIGADPCLDGDHLCGCSHTGRHHGSLQAQPGVDDILVL